MDTKCENQEIYGSMLYNKLLKSCNYLLDQKVINDSEYRDCKEIINTTHIDYNQDTELRKYTGGKKDIKQLEYETKKNMFRKRFKGLLKEWEIWENKYNGDPSNLEVKETADDRKKQLDFLLQDIRNYILIVTREYSNRDNTNQYYDLVSKFKLIEKHKLIEKDVNSHLVENKEKGDIYDKKILSYTKKQYTLVVIIFIIIILIIVSVIFIMKI